jgi:hypothetical protein
MMDHPLLGPLGVFVQQIAAQTTLLAVSYAALVSLPLAGLISNRFPPKKPQRWAFVGLFCFIGLGAFCAGALTLAGFTYPFQNGVSNPKLAVLSAYFWGLSGIFAFTFAGLEIVWRNSRN